MKAAGYDVREKDPFEVTQRVSGEIAKMRQRKRMLEGEIRNLTKAIAESGHSKFILDEIAVREPQIEAITDRLLSFCPESVEARINEIRNHVEQKIAGLSDLLSSNPPGAKQELLWHLQAITMHPVKDNRRGWYYEAESSWNLLGTDKQTLTRSQQPKTRMRGVFGWLRVLDLNQRSLGYENRKQRSITDLRRTAGSLEPIS
jgi:hypothetical protein